MCLTIYVASEVPLPVIPWDEARPAFHVSDATDDYFYPTNPLRQHSDRPHFYALNSHNGCGCGFQKYGIEWDEAANDMVEITSPEQIECRRALADYLTAALRHQPNVEVLTFCSGDESCPPTIRRAARPADFATDGSLFEMWQVVVVSNPDAEPGAAADGGA